MLTLPVLRMLQRLSGHVPPRRDPTYCPICGFLLANDLDGHFVPCVAGRTREVWFSGADAGDAGR